MLAPPNLSARRIQVDAHEGNKRRNTFYNGNGIRPISPAYEDMKNVEAEIETNATPGNRKR